MSGARPGHPAEPDLGPRLQMMDIGSLSEADVSAWRDLAAHALEPNPCFEAGYLIPATEAFGHADMRLAVVVHDGRWLAMLPVQRLWRWRGLPVPVTAAWTHYVAFLGHPLIHDDHLDLGVASLLRPLAARRGTVGLIIESAPAGRLTDAMIGALTPGRRGVVLERFARAEVHRDADMADRQPGQSKLAKKMRRLANAAGGPVCVVDVTDEPDAVDAFLALEATGWKGRNNTAMANTPVEAEFFRRMCANFASDDRLQILALRAGTLTVAMKVNLVSGQTVFTDKIAFDETFAAYSPGRILEREALKLFHRDGQADLMNSCAAPRGSVVDDIWPDRREIVSVLIPAAGIIGQLAGRAVSMRAALKRRRRTSGAFAHAGPTSAAPPAVSDGGTRV